MITFLNFILYSLAWIVGLLIFFALPLALFCLVGVIAGDKDRDGGTSWPVVWQGLSRSAFTSAYRLFSPSFIL